MSIDPFLRVKVVAIGLAMLVAGCLVTGCGVGGRPFEVWADPEYVGARVLMDGDTLGVLSGLSATGQSLKLVVAGPMDPESVVVVFRNGRRLARECKGVDFEYVWIDKDANGEPRIELSP
jgi:hypothetical protein